MEFCPELQMLLFPITSAVIFSAIPVFWQMPSRYRTPLRRTHR